MSSKNPQLIYKYPQSSCECEGCPGVSAPYYISPEDRMKIPTNLGVGDCSIDVRCYDKKLYKQNDQPNPTPPPRANIILNKLGPVYSPEFTEINCKRNGNGCEGISYTSKDPRLLNAVTNDLIKLDTPPLISYNQVGNVCRDNIYDESRRNYGSQIRTYYDIKDGLISYYIDTDISDPYFNPNYTQSSTIDYLLYKDPMTAIKPLYYRKPIVNYTQNPQSGQGNDQYTYDTLYYREDLMSKQSEKMNQERWSNRWSNSPYYRDIAT